MKMKTHTNLQRAKGRRSPLTGWANRVVWVLGVFALSACGEHASGTADATNGEPADGSSVAANHWRCWGDSCGCLIGPSPFCVECESFLDVGVGAPGGPAPTEAEIASAARLENGLYRTALFVEAITWSNPALVTIAKVRAIGTEPGATSIRCVERNSDEDCNTVTDWQRLWPGGTSSADYWEEFSAGLPCESTTTIELELNWPVSQGRTLPEGGLWFEIEYRRNSDTPEIDVVRF